MATPISTIVFRVFDGKKRLTLTMVDYSPDQVPKVGEKIELPYLLTKHRELRGYDSTVTVEDVATDPDIYGPLVKRRIKVILQATKKAQ